MQIHRSFGAHFLMEEIRHSYFVPITSPLLMALIPLITLMPLHPLIFFISHFTFFISFGEISSFHLSPPPNFAFGNAPQRVVETPVGRADS